MPEAVTTNCGSSATTCRQRARKAVTSKGWPSGSWVFRSRSHQHAQWKTSGSSATSMCAIQ